jgi:hypothetical protein
MRGSGFLFLARLINPDIVMTINSPVSGRGRLSTEFHPFCSASSSIVYGLRLVGTECFILFEPVLQPSISDGRTG